MLPDGSRIIGPAPTRLAQNIIGYSTPDLSAPEILTWNALFPTEKANSKNGTHYGKSEHHADWQ